MLTFGKAEGPVSIFALNVAFYRGKTEVVMRLVFHLERKKECLRLHNLSLVLVKDEVVSERSVKQKQTLPKIVSTKQKRTTASAVK